MSTAASRDSRPVEPETRAAKPAKPDPAPRTGPARQAATAAARAGATAAARSGAAGTARGTRPTGTQAGQPAPPAVLLLQATAGNAAVSRMLAPPTAAGAPRPPAAPIGDTGAGRPTVQRQPVAAPPAPDTLDGAAGTTPDTDPRFHALRTDLGRQAAHAKTHPAAGAEVRAATDAAVAPADDRQAQAEAAQVDRMAAAKPGGFDKAAFIAAVDQAIARQAPKNLDEADSFAASGRADAIKPEVLGKVGAGKDAAAKEIADRTRQAPDTGAAVDKPVTPLSGAPAPPALGVPDPNLAVPRSAPAAQTDLHAPQRETAGAMAAAGVTDEQLAGGNEPQFDEALAAKRAADTHSDTAAAPVREAEAARLADTRDHAQAAGQATIAGMLGARTASDQHGTAAKTATKDGDERERTRITGEIRAIFDATKADVEKLLGAVDAQVATRFDEGEKAARAAFTADHQARMRAYKDARYSGLLGKAAWVRDKFAGLPAEANGIFALSRQLYESRMRLVISDVADLVGDRLNQAKERIAAGRAQVRAKVAEQPAQLRGLAGKAARDFDNQFAELDASVDEKQQTLVDDLAERYTAARGAVEEDIRNLQAENRGLWDAAKQAVGGAIETISKLKDLLLGVLARAANAVTLIIRDPIGFLGNLVSAVKAGVLGFGERITTHLKNGLKSWLLGNLANAGVEVPETFDVKGILTMVFSVLGLTWSAIRARIVRLIPEPVLAALEKTVDVVKILVTEGLPGLWRWVVEKIGDVKEMVLGEIKQWVIVRLVTAGLKWLVSMLNPVAAFIKACKAIYDVVMFFVDRAAQIKDFVDSVLDSIESIARGGAGAVARLVENALAKAVPVVLGLFASILGLGDIAGKIRGIIAKIQEPIGKVVDKVVGTVVKAGKKLLGRFRGKDEDPAAKQKRLDAGLSAAQAAVNRFAGKAVTGRLLAPLLVAIRLRYRMTRLEVVPGGDRWVVSGAVNPEGTLTTDAKISTIDPAKVAAAATAASGCYARARAAYDQLQETLPTASTSQQAAIRNATFACSPGTEPRLQGGGTLREAVADVSAAWRHRDAAEMRRLVRAEAQKEAYLNDPTLTPAQLSRMLADSAFLAQVRERLEAKGVYIPKGNRNDRGLPGSTSAVHAEKLVYASGSPQSIGVSRPTCDDCAAYFKAQARNRGDVIVIDDGTGVKVYLPDGTIKRPEDVTATTTA